MADLPQGMPYAIGDVRLLCILPAAACALHPASSDSAHVALYVAGPLSHLQSYWEPWESKCNLLPRGGPGFDGPVDASEESQSSHLSTLTKSKAANGGALYITAHCKCWLLTPEKLSALLDPAGCFSMYTDLYMATDIENLRLNPMAKEFVPPGTFRKAPFPTGFHPMGPGSQVHTCAYRTCSCPGVLCPAAACPSSLSPVCGAFKKTLQSQIFVHPGPPGLRTLQPT